jgi:peptidylprolyl isomerase
MRPPAAVAALALLAVVTACGGSDDDDGGSATAASTVPSATSTPDGTTAEDTAPEATTPEGTAVEDTVVDGTLVPATTAPPASVPEVELPTDTPTELAVTVITPGTGAEAADGDSVFVNYVGVRSEDGTEFDNNYGGSPFPVTLGAGGVIPGWEQGLQGAQAGSQVQLDIPADLAYGDNPQGDIIQPGDALSFVIDVLAVVPAVDAATAPTADDVPTASEPVTELTVEDITPGDGAELAEGDTAVVHLIAARGDTGEVVESTWTSGQPQPVVVASGQLLDGLVEGLPGMQVGGRRAVTIPFSTFPEGSLEQLGVPAETDVVVIADLFAVL